MTHANRSLADLLDEGLNNPHNGGIFYVYCKWIEMPEKRTPHYPLATIKAAFAQPADLNRTFSAMEGAESLGLVEADIVAVIQDLADTDFNKSMTSQANATIWQDVYKPSRNGKRIYVKFTLNAQRDLLLISFKEA